MKRRGQGGYTIIEVMIVLVVSVALFISVAALLSGSQSRTETTQAVRNLESRIQNVISDIGAGYYPTGVGCSAGGSGQPTIIGSAIGGSNEGCIFLGKVVPFETDRIQIASVLGRQFIGAIGTRDVASLIEARPIAAPASTNDSYNFTYGLRAMTVRQMDGANTRLSSLAFMSELGGGVSTGSPVTGSRSVLLYGFTGNVGSAPAIDNPNLYRPLPEGARICLLGANDRWAEIQVGSGANQTSTFVNIDLDASHVCRN